MVDTELMGRDPLMGMIVEEVGSNKEVSTDINTVVEGSEALDMFMDLSNPYNKTVHAALQTVAEDMKARLLEKGLESSHLWGKFCTVPFFSKGKRKARLPD